jgi:hypothetical protein
MHHQISSNSNNFHRAINPEQFDQVVEAILAGKYSWACVLMLRFAGYNPLHYIPYRTYNRLLKENAQLRRATQQRNENPKITSLPAASCVSKVKDLAYLEVVTKKKTEIPGGS